MPAGTYILILAEGPVNNARPLARYSAFKSRLVARNAAPRQTAARGLFSGLRGSHEHRHHADRESTASSMSASSWTATKSYGPYCDADAAETMAARFAGICRGVFHQQVAIGVVRQPAANDGLMRRSANGRSRRPA